MPKKKSNKILSLVSAYESDAESEGDTEETNNSEEEKFEEENESVKSDSRGSGSYSRTEGSEKPNTPSEHAYNDKKAKSDDANMSIDEVNENEDNTQSFGEISNGSEKVASNEIKDQPRDDQSQNTVTDSIEEPNADTNFSLYTIENGFPSTCINIRLPPAPQAQCSQGLQNKIVQVLNQMERYNYSMNEDIHKRKNFKNPSIYEKLIERYGIDEFGSNFPNHIENLKEQGYMYYDELDTAQKADWEKKAKEKKERTKIEMVTAVKKK